MLWIEMDTRTILEIKAETHKEMIDNLKRSFLGHVCIRQIQKYTKVNWTQLTMRFLQIKAQKLGSDEQERTADSYQEITHSLLSKLRQWHIVITVNLRRVSFQASSQSKMDILNLVYSNICDPMEMESMDGNKYFVTLIDDASWNCRFVYWKPKTGHFKLSWH